MKASTANQWLAWCIFVLWSLGIIVIPWLGNMETPRLLVTSLSYLYNTLHIVIFLFTSYLLVHLFRFAPRKKREGFYIQALLYVFVLATLAISFYFIVSTANTPL